MNDRTLVKLCATESCVSFRTVSSAGKSPHSFYITRKSIAELETSGIIIAQDCGSFAELRLNRAAGTLCIRFTWLSGGDRQIKGRRETVKISYERFLDFLKRSAQPNSPKEYSILTLKEISRPHLVFCGRENLHAALTDPIVRRKLVRFLRDNFNWADSEKVCFYNDFAPYSFFFREFANGQPGICGGLIFHGQENLEKSSYSIHT